MSKEKKYRKKKKLGNYPAVSVVFSVTLALFVMGLFALLLLITQNLTRVIQENVEIQVFLNNDLNENEIDKIKKVLSSKDYVQKKVGQAQIDHVTREEAAATFMEETGEDFVNFLSDNPLRDVIIIKINPDFQAPENLAEIKKEIEFIRGVYEVAYIENLVSAINQNVKKVSYLLIAFCLILFTVVVVLINNTIKLALFSQRFLIRSMQLVGATSAFIRKPFLRRASFLGLLSGVVSLGLLVALLQWVDKEIEGVTSLLSMEQIATLAGAIILIGILVGFISTFVAIKKYMKMSLDELY